MALVDGDDWFYDDKALQILNQEYFSYNLLCSYGSYYQYRKGELNKSYLKGAREFPENIVKTSGYRNYQWTSQHLRTARAKLFKQIKLIDILDHEGKFLRMCTDVAEMMPVLEMAGKHHKNILKPLYVYNRGNSVRYKTSFYRLKEDGNEKNDKYHTKIKDTISGIKPYPNMSPKNVFESENSFLINVVSQNPNVNMIEIKNSNCWNFNWYNLDDLNNIESYTPTIYLSDNVNEVEELSFYLNKLKYFIMSDSDYLGHGLPLPEVYIYLTHKDSQEENVIAFRNDIKANKKWKLLENGIPSGIYRPKIFKQCLKGNEKNIQIVSLCLEFNESHINFDNQVDCVKNDKKLEDEEEDEDDNTISFEISIDDSFDDDDK